jgi:hypothetical protein
LNLRRCIWAAVLAIVSAVVGCGGSSAREDGNQPKEQSASGNRQITQAAISSPERREARRKLRVASRDQALRLIGTEKQQQRGPAGGCSRVVVSESRQRYWGPPAPHLSAIQVGDHAEIRYQFRSIPDNVGCRPYTLIVTVYSGQPGSATFKGSTAEYRVSDLIGEEKQALPAAGKPPYQVLANSRNLKGLPSTRVVVPLG